MIDGRQGLRELYSLTSQENLEPVMVSVLTNGVAQTAITRVLGVYEDPGKAIIFIKYFVGGTENRLCCDFFPAQTPFCIVTRPKLEEEID